MLVCLPAEMMTLKMLQIIAAKKNYVDVISEKERKIVSDKMMKNIFGL